MNKAQQLDDLRLRINPSMVTLLAIVFLVIGGVLQPIGKSQTFECSRTTPESGSCALSHKEMGKTAYSVQVITDTGLIWRGD